MKSRIVRKLRAGVWGCFACEDGGMPKNEAQLAPEHSTQTGQRPARPASRERPPFLDSFGLGRHKFRHWRGPFRPRELLRR
jgi:hypothetical protein